MCPEVVPSDPADPSHLVDLGQQMSVSVRRERNTRDRNSSDLHRDVAIGAQKRDAAMFSPKQASLSCACEVFCELGGLAL